MSGFRIILSALFTFFLLSIIGCEEEGSPLTLDDIYEANDGDRPLFRMILNTEEFSSENAQGVKVGDEIIISAGDNGGQIRINITDFIPGTYSGVGKNKVSNQIKYTNASGEQFISNRQDEISDAQIIINHFNEDESRISGRVTGLLYDLNFKKDIYITNGVFNGLFIDAPFLGRMSAVADGENFNSLNCFYSSTKTSEGYLDRVIARSKDDSLRITFQIEEKIKVGTYHFGDTIASGVYNSNVFSSNKQQNEYTSEAGSIVITSIDSVRNKLKGNFNFEAKNQNGETINIHSGNFNALIN